MPTSAISVGIGQITAHTTIATTARTSVGLLARRRRRRGPTRAGGPRAATGSTARSTGRSTPAGSPGRARCGWPAACRTLAPSAASAASVCSRSRGRATARMTSPSVAATGIAWKDCASGSGSRWARSKSGSKSVRPTRCIWYCSESAATRVSSEMAPWATRMSPSGSPVREYSTVATCSSSSVTRPLFSSIWAICVRTLRLRRRLDDVLVGRVDRVDRGDDLVDGVLDQLDRAVDALGDDLLGDPVAGIGGGHQHGAVGDGVRHDPEGAADALGQEVRDLGVDPLGEADRGERGGRRGHRVPAPKPPGAAGSPGWTTSVRAGRGRITR